MAAATMRGAWHSGWNGARIRHRRPGSAAGMLAVLIVIGVLGIGLPAGLGLIARRRKDLAEKPDAYGEINKWLLGEYGLGARDRSLVQRAVLGRYAPISPMDERVWRKPIEQGPVPLRADLLAAARGLAVRVAANQFRSQRAARWMFGVTQVVGAGYAGFGIFVLATGWGGQRFSGGWAVVNAALLIWSGAYFQLAGRRRRRTAQRYLAAARSQHPGAPGGPGSREEPGSPPRPGGNGASAGT